MDSFPTTAGEFISIGDDVYGNVAGGLTNCRILLDDKQQSVFQIESHQK